MSRAEIDAFKESRLLQYLTLSILALLPFSTALLFGKMATASAVKKKLVVCGGNGFLGNRICKAAVAREWDVTSIR